MNIRCLSIFLNFPTKFATFFYLFKEYKVEYPDKAEAQEEDLADKSEEDNIDFIY